MEDAKMESFRDWADLPGDLLRSIDELLGMPYCIWFRVVCQSWRAALPGLPRPWLVIPDGWRASENMHHFTFVTIPEPIFERLALPNSPCVGSTAGWLALLDANLVITLLNPLTRAQVRLPTLLCDGRLQASSVGFVVGTIQDMQPRVYQHNLIHKIAFSADPTAQDHAVAVLCRSGLGLAFLKAGQDDWQWMNWPDAAGREEPGLGEVNDSGNTDLDITYHNGKFYYMTLCGQIWSIDAAASAPVVPVPFAKCRPQLGPDHRHYGKHLVFDQDGTMYVVWSDGPGLPWNTRTRPLRMQVQRYHPGSSRHRLWRKARHLSGQAFLIGNRSQSLAVPSSTVSAPSTWIRPNCVYFTCIMPGSDYIATYECLHPDIWEFNVKTGVFRVVCDIDDFPDWVEWTKAIWFTPSLS
ncbi:unnamed protein product [Alopecurus aequalis]